MPSTVASETNAPEFMVAPGARLAWRGWLGDEGGGLGARPACGGGGARGLVPIAPARAMLV